MNRSCRIGFWTLAMLVASACSEDALNDLGSTCPPFCGTRDPAQAYDSGTGGSQDPNTSPDAGTWMSPDTGVVTPRPDASVTSPDSGGGAFEDAGPNPGDSDAGVIEEEDAGNDPDPTTPALPPVSDYLQRGPFKTTSTANVGPNRNYTIFRPDPLGENGFLHAPIIFGPGILTSAGGYEAILDHLASHGFVTISVNSMSGGPGASGNLQAMKTGLDWILEQNTAAGVFQGKLAVDRAVAMGYSIGATASVQLSSHPAVATTVAIHGHRTQGDPHGPVLLITGTEDVINDVRATFSSLDEAPALLVALPIGHLDVLNELPVAIAGSKQLSKSTRYAAPITAWLRYWIYGDGAAKRYFWGESCEMCSSPWITPESNAKWKALNL